MVQCFVKLDEKPTHSEQWKKIAVGFELETESCVSGLRATKGGWFVVNAGLDYLRLFANEFCKVLAAFEGFAFHTHISTGVRHLVSNTKSHRKQMEYM